MARRDVDSTVLRELAAATVRARGDIERHFSSANNRVNSAPGGWDRGRWDGVPSFIRMELETMDREQRELFERALKVDLVAAVTALPDGVPLSAWKFLVATIDGPAFAFFLAPGVVEGFVAKVSEFSKDFQAKNGKAPSVDDLKLWVGNTIGGIGLVLGARKVTETPAVTGVNRYHGKVVVNGKTLTDDELFDRAREIRAAYEKRLGRSPTDAEYDAAMRLDKPTADLDAWINVTRQLSQFFDENEGQRVADLGGNYVGECVSLAKQWAHAAFGVTLGAFNSGPAASWETGSGFDEAEWDTIDNDGRYEVGDLVFFAATAANGGFGHIGIVSSEPDENGDFGIVEQNIPTGTGTVRRRTVNTSDTLGVRRYTGG